MDRRRLIVTQKKVTTPEDKSTEDKAVRLQTELYLSESNVPKFRISKDRRAEIKKELNSIVLQLGNTNRPGEGTQNILSVIKQRARNNVSKETGEKVTSPVESPKSRPNKDYQLPRGVSLFREIGDKIKSTFKEKPKMMYGGVANKKKHNYAAGGSVKDKLGVMIAVGKIKPKDG